MRFLLDESADARLVPYSRANGHDVTRLVTDFPAGMPDPDVLSEAVRERRVLVTNDRDFGDLVFLQKQSHTGVILFRLGDDVELATKITRLEHVLTHYAEDLDQFLVVTHDRVRVRRSKREWESPTTPSILSDDESCVPKDASTRVLGGVDKCRRLLGIWVSRRSMSCMMQ